MADVLVRFDGSGVTSGEIACVALQPVIDTVYRRCRWEPLPVVEKTLRYVGRGTFSWDRIENFASYISAGDRPVLTSGHVDVDRPGPANDLVCGDGDVPSDAEAVERDSAL